MSARRMQGLPPFPAGSIDHLLSAVEGQTFDPFFGSGVAKLFGFFILTLQILNMLTVVYLEHATSGSMTWIRLQCGSGNIVKIIGAKGVGKTGT